MIDEKRKAEIRKNIEGVRRDFVLNVTPARINISFDDLDRLLRAERIDEAKRCETIAETVRYGASTGSGFACGAFAAQEKIQDRIAELENTQ